MTLTKSQQPLALALAPAPAAGFRLAGWIAALVLAPAIARASPEKISALARSLPDSSASQVGALAEAHLDHPPLAPAIESAWWHLVFYRWCEIDAAAAGEFAVASADERDGILRYFFVAAIEHGAESAADLAGSLGDEAAKVYAGLVPPPPAADQPAEAAPDTTPAPEDLLAQIDQAMDPTLSQRDQWKALDAAMGSQISADPAGTLAWIATAARSPTEREALLESFGRHVERGGLAEASAAEKSFARLPPTKASVKLGAKLALAWAERDPGAAVAWAGQLPFGPARDSALAAAAYAAIEENPLATMDLLERNAWRMDVENAWAYQSTAIPAQSHRHGGGGRGPGSMLFGIQTGIEHLVANGEPAEAMARLAMVPDPKIREDLIKLAVKTWVEDDISGAIKWLANAPPGLVDGRDTVAEGLTAMVSSGELSTATAIVAQIDDLATMRRAVGTITKSAANADPAIVSQLVDWAGSLRGEQRDHAEYSIVFGLKDSDPIAAANLLTTIDLQLGEQKAWGTVVKALHGRDPIAAAAFFETRAEHVPDYALADFTSTWLRSSPEGVSTWLIGFPKGGARDSALVAMVGYLAQPRASQDLDAAAAWAAEIGDAQARHQALASIQQERDRPGTTPSRQN
ncbi:hypothetical protein BH23VER1_BH23VER1_04850 [soil metagenome]